MTSALSTLAVQLAADLGSAHVRLDEGARLLVVAPADDEAVARVVRAAASDPTLAVRVARAGDEGRPPAPRQDPSAARADGARPTLRLDLSRLVAVHAIDEISLIAHVGAGLLLEHLLAQLAPRGLWLGAAPVRSLPRTFGALVTAPRPSEATPRGRLVDRCAAARFVLADGTLATTRLAPRKATGPDLLQAIVGARGTTAVVTSVWLRVERRPPQRAHIAFAFADDGAGLAAARAFIDAGARPADLALADGDAGTPEAAGATLLAIALAGAPELVAAEAALGAEIAAAHGGRALASTTAEGFFSRAPRFAVADERLVASRDIAGVWASRARPSQLRAISPTGAALLSSAPRSSLAPGAAAARARARVVRALDPQGRFAPHAAPPGSRDA